MTDSLLHGGDKSASMRVAEDATDGLRMRRPESQQNRGLSDDSTVGGVAPPLQRAHRSNASRTRNLSLNPESPQTLPKIPTRLIFTQIFRFSLNPPADSCLGICLLTVADAHVRPLRTDVPPTPQVTP